MQESVIKWKTFFIWRKTSWRKRWHPHKNKNKKAKISELQDHETTKYPSLSLFYLGNAKTRNFLWRMSKKRTDYQISFLLFRECLLTVLYRCFDEFSFIRIRRCFDEFSLIRIRSASWTSLGQSNPTQWLGHFKVRLDFSSGLKIPTKSKIGLGLDKTIGQPN